jgi:cyclin-dependent kinase 2
MNSNYFALKMCKKFRVSEKKQTDANEKPNKEEKPKDLNFLELRELIIMKRIKHQNVINLIDYNIGHQDCQVWILMEYIPTDLFQFLSKNHANTKVMNEKFFKNIAYQILDGVNYLHQHMIIHRDLKLENILYDETNNKVKIGDFGLSRQIDYEVDHHYTIAGTCPYQSPELILGSTNYSTAIDIWSVGCIFVLFVTYTHLFGSDNALNVLKLMINIFGSFNETLLPGYNYFPNSKIFKIFEKTKECKGIGLVNYIKSKKLFDFENDDFYDLIEKMLYVDPTKRINAEKCLSHPWFAKKY